MADVFISYKRENLASVQLLVNALRDQKLTVWWDQDIPPGAPWEETIEREHHRAKVVLVAWSKASVASENVKAEARHARHDGKLIQVFVEVCDPPMFFGERQGVNLVGWNGRIEDHSFLIIFTAIRAVMGGKPPPIGVGYAPKQRNWGAIAVTALAIISGGLGLISNTSGARSAMCSLSVFTSTCHNLKLTPPPPLDPAVLAAQTKAKLIHGVDGRWDRQTGTCTSPISITTSSEPDGESRIKVSNTEGFVSEGQIIAADNGAIVSRTITVTPRSTRDQWEYRPNGDQLTIVNKDGVATTLVRCRSAAEEAKP